MKTTKLLAALALCSLSTSNAQAASITHYVDSNWTVSPWNHVGDVAAQQWQYLNYAPWDASLGTRQSVSITSTVNGTRAPADGLGLRDAFLTGWTPNPYQSSAADAIAAGGATAASVSEPASELLMLAALCGLAIAVRRKMPEQG